MGLTETFSQDANGNIGVQGTVTANAGTGVFSVNPAGSTTSTITSVASAITSTSLLAANVNRKGFILYNNSTKTVFVAFAATATAVSFTILMPAASLYEAGINYTGVVSAIWSAANGAMLVTELT